MNDINHAPIITIQQHPVIEKGNSINFFEFLVATDEEDGNITDKIKQITSFNNQQIGTQDIVFEVTDSHGKSTQATMVVTVVKGNAPPQIQVDHQTIFQYEPFDPLKNACAVDEEDGTITHKITTSGEVDTSILGIYEVAYRVVDSKGACDEKTIQVEVKRNPREKIRYISTKKNKLFYHEAVPKNWINRIQFLIEQLENPRQFAQSTFQN